MNSAETTSRPPGRASGSHATDQPSVRQVLAGPMGNCLYILSDPSTQRALLVDPAWDPLGLLELARGEGFEVEGVLATHFHQDHVGGELFGQKIPGLSELLNAVELPVYIHEIEAEKMIEQTGINAAAVRPFGSEASLVVGEVEIRALHTPGHSPGCTSFLAGGHLIAGDTLFVQGCGRVDLPGSDADAMFHSLRRLAELPPETVVYPGHNYGPTPTSTIGDELERNVHLRVATIEQWRVLMGGYG